MALAIFQMPYMAIETSVLAMASGVPFGGTVAWTLAFVTIDDSSESPYTPVIAAIVGWPITMVCDIIFFIPSIIVWSVRKV